MYKTLYDIDPILDFRLEELDQCMLDFFANMHTDLEITEDTWDVYCRVSLDILSLLGAGVPDRYAA